MQFPSSRSTLRMLRRRAEALYRTSSQRLLSETPVEVLDLVQQLRIYQTELEMQYEGLLTLQEGAERSRLELANLYHTAPVGYCTLSYNGVLRRLNLFTSQLLGQPAELLIGQLLGAFVVPDEQGTFTHFLSQLLRTPGQRRSCEVRLRGSDAQQVLHVQVEGLAVLPGPEVGQQAGYRLVLLDVSERRRAEAALAASMSRFQATFEQSYDGMILLEGHQFVACNNAALRLLGLHHPEQLQGHSLAEFWPDEQPGGRSTLEVFWDCLSRAESWGWCRVELLRHSPTGGSVWDELSFNPVLLQGRALLHASWRDITARKHIESELQRSQASLQEALAAADTGVWSWHLPTDTIQADARAQRLLGLGSGHSFELLKVLIHPADLPTVEQALAEARRERAPFDIEHRLVLPSGASRYVAVTGRFSYDEATGAACRLDALVRDVTARHHTEQELDYKNRLLSHLLQQAPLLLARIGADGRFREYTGLPLRRMGLADNELVGRLAAEEFPRSAPYFAQVLAGEPVNYAITLERGGQRLWLQVFGFFDAERQEAVLFGTDLTETEQLKEEANRQRQRQQQELHAVMLTTQEEERRRIAESLHNGVGQLLYATRLHLDQLPPTDELRASQDLLTEAIRATRTVSFELTPPVLNDFGLPTALRELTNRLPPGSLRLDLHLAGLDEPLPMLLQTAAYRIVQELLNNVIKHAQAQEVFVSVVREHDLLHLSVEDNGQGFDRPAPGGIGLTSIQTRVGLLGGVVDIKSRAGRGTNVFLQLPVHS